MLFGVPDCGKVCSEQHVPSYLARLGELRQLGVSKILCVAVGDEAAAKAWAAQQELADGSKIQVVSDPNATFTRFMGMELAAPDAAGPRSQRYAAVVDDGVLLKVVSAGGVAFAITGAHRMLVRCNAMRRASRSPPPLPPSTRLQCVDKSPGEAKASTADSIISVLKAMH